MELNQLKAEAEKAIEKAGDLKDLDDIFRKYLGKKGVIADVFVSLKNLSSEDRKQVGEATNKVKIDLENALEQKTKELKSIRNSERVKKEKIDITRPGIKFETGHLHPLTLIQKEASEIFQSMGFEIAEGPEVETEWYNFDALNIPESHPARDMWDTFWLQSSQKVNSKLKTQNSKLLMRTHTSPVQVRYMESHNPPLKIIAPGRVFRHEATDSSHEIQFYQLEGLMVDKEISVANFKAIIEEFLSRFFKNKVEIRLRPSFFPFTEPSFEIDVKMGKNNWLELMGAGMVNQKVFKATGYMPKEWQGFAFGCGIDRLAMVKYKIKDIRIFYQNDLRFLKQF